MSLSLWVDGRCKQTQQKGPFSLSPKVRTWLGEMGVIISRESARLMYMCDVQFEFSRTARRRSRMVLLVNIKGLSTRLCVFVHKQPHSPTQDDQLRRKTRPVSRANIHKLSWPGKWPGCPGWVTTTRRTEAKSHSPVRYDELSVLVGAQL